MDSRSNAASMVQPAQKVFLFVNKTAGSVSLSHSEGSERRNILSTAQFTTRKTLREDRGRAVQPRTTHRSTYSVYSRYNNSQAHKQRSKLSGLTHLQVVPAAPPSDHVNRILLTARFLESYYPTDMPAQVRVVDKLRQWIEPKCGAVALASADCIILLHAAQVTGNETLRKHGMPRYHQALRLLRDRLQNPESVRDDSVLGAVESMGVVETRLLQSSDGDLEETKRAHTSGLYALILARGPPILQSNMGRNILLQHLHEFLMVSLLSRKACVFGNSDWQTAFENMEPDDTGTMHRLTALGCCIPEGLEKADTIINDKVSTDVQRMNLLSELLILEDHFSRWLLDRYRKLPRGKPYSIATASLSTLFYDQPAALQDCYPFPAVIEHRSFMDALAHLNYWGLLLILRKTILDVFIALHSRFPPSAIPVGISRDFRNRCDEVAGLFCQSICYIYKLPEHQSMIGKQGIVAFLMSTILPWYSYDQNKDKLSWCSRVLQTFQNEHTDLDLLETVQHTWTTKLYIGWVNMAF